jgi:biopolymer transport protein ExbB
VLMGLLAGLVGSVNAPGPAAPAPAAAGAPVVKVAGIEQPTNASATERLTGAWKFLVYLHVAGGGCMYGIDVLVVVGVAFMLERTFRMRRRRVLPMALMKEIDAHLEKGDFDGAVEACKRQPNSTISRAVLCLKENADAAVDEREVAVNEVASREMDLHRMICLPLTAVSALAPLIGLLGTVVGIRECFRDVALAGEMGNPSMLAGGIEKALITTIYGLVVAIPVVFGYSFFRFRINLLANELEDALTVILRRYSSLKGKRNEV